MQQNQKIDYVEFPGDGFDALETFYSAVFGWKFTDYGPEYRAFTDDVMNGGFYKSSLRSRTESGAVLVVLFAEDLEATQGTVVQHGGKISKEIFSFPGGRRFHFYDPHGNELAVWSEG